MAVSGYGTWKSPISSQVTTASGVTLQQLSTDSDANFSDLVYWNEVHSDEGGRYVVCSSDAQGNVTQWTPKDFNARTTVHEYGGGDFMVHRGVVYFSNFKDQGLYRQTSPDSDPEPVCDLSKSWRYADGFFSTKNSLMYYVREDHEVVKTGAKECQNTIVAIDPVNKSQKVLMEGSNFYSCPRVSPDGSQIAWVQWNHPNMPWDRTEIWRAQLSNTGDEIVAGSPVKVSGGVDASGQDISVILPSWTEDGQLMYIGDQTNWWNLYQVTPLAEHKNLRSTDTEIGSPQWQMGRNAYVSEPNGDRIATTYDSELGILDAKSLAYKKIETGFTTHKCVAWTGRGSLYLIASSPTQFPQVIRVDANTLKVNVIRVSMSPPVDSSYFSVPERISWPTTHEEMSHGLLYNPKNKDFQAKPGELPPVLIRAHGGPTANYSSSLDLKIQYWTSRGFAVLCVDYRGSTGYGKVYRHRLRTQWGVLDIDDCRTGVEHLVKQQLADPQRICIDGGSAGGFTTLACLTFTQAFTTGVSHYGVSDLAALAADTHKFESQYLFTLLAPPGPAFEEVSKQRSPIHHTDQINCAVGFFQGDEDKIVPPNQAQMMFDAVKAKGLPAMYVLFEGEQHGFRKAENIRTALDGEFYFFGKVLGFEPADQVPELPIYNL